MDKYKQIREIGHGAFGRAILVTHKETNEEFVVKIIKSELITGRNKEDATKEVEVLKKLQHENIVSYIESFEERLSLHIVMTYCSEGNLADKIRKTGSNLFIEQEILKTFRQLCQAVDYMHSKNILHRDIKPENVFLTSYGVVKLGDFGLSRVLDTSLQYALTMAGTFCYMSPEILDGKKYKNRSDMWSLGCVLYEMTTLKRAFLTIGSIISGKFAPIPPQYSEDLRELIAELLSLIPENRPSAGDILIMTFIQTESFKQPVNTSSVITDLDFFMIGGRGNGRSTTGNTILGIPRAFKESNDFENGEHAVSDVKWCRRGKQILKVIDGPCISESRSKLRHPAQVFTHCPRGFHALLFVLNFASPRLTAEDNFLISFLKQNLGKDIFRDHGILIITHGECFDLFTSRREWMTFETWCQRQEGSLGELIKECGNRVVLFSNLSPKKEEESVHKLLALAQSIDKFFTCDFLLDMQRQMKAVNMLPENILGRIDLCVNELRKYLDSKKMADYQHLKCAAANLLAEIVPQEQNSLSVRLESLVSPLTGREKLVCEKLEEIYFTLEKIQEPYRRIAIKNSRGTAKCSIY